MNRKTITIFLIVAYTVSHGTLQSAACKIFPIICQSEHSFPPTKYRRCSLSAPPAPAPEILDLLPFELGPLAKENSDQEFSSHYPKEDPQESFSYSPELLAALKTTLQTPPPCFADESDLIHPQESLVPSLLKRAEEEYQATAAALDAQAGRSMDQLEREKAKPNADLAKINTKIAQEVTRRDLRLARNTLEYQRQLLQICRDPSK